MYMKTFTLTIFKLSVHHCNYSGSLTDCLNDFSVFKKRLKNQCFKNFSTRQAKVFLEGNKFSYIFFFLLSSIPVHYFGLVFLIYVIYIYVS